MTTTNRKQRRTTAAQGRKAKPSKGKIWTSSRGISVKLLPVSPFLWDELQASVQMGDEPKPPTYTVETATGEEQTFSHDATTLETDDDRAAWDAYQAELAAFRERLAAVNLEKNRRLVATVFLEGVVVREGALEDGADWLRRRELAGLDAPSDRLERLLLYVKTQVIGSKSDIVDMMIEIMRLTGVADRDLLIAEDSFRRAMEGEAPSDEVPGSDGRAVDVQPPVSGA